MSWTMTGKLRRRQPNDICTNRNRNHEKSDTHTSLLYSHTHMYLLVNREPSFFSSPLSFEASAHFLHINKRSFRDPRVRNRNNINEIIRQLAVQLFYGQQETVSTNTFNSSFTLSLIISCRKKIKCTDFSKVKKTAKIIDWIDILIKILLFQGRIHLKSFLKYVISVTTVLGKIWLQTLFSK